MRQLPTGTVSLLFTDIEGSTRLLSELGRVGYVPALREHRRLLREAFTEHGGVEVEMQGDSFFFAFPFARDALAAAAAGQRALAEHRWQSQPIRVRMGVHTGEPEQADGLYAGLDVHRAARVMSVASGGQVLVSARTADLVDGELPEGLTLRDLGEHRLKDLDDPIRLYQVGEARFPPLRTPATVELPTPATRFLGRDDELFEAL
jgi:class 3 adenylate cyclase